MTPEQWSIEVLAFLQAYARGPSGYDQRMFDKATALIRGAPRNLAPVDDNGRPSDVGSE